MQIWVREPRPNYIFSMGMRQLKNKGDHSRKKYFKCTSSFEEEKKYILKFYERIVPLTIVLINDAEVNMCR